MYSFGSHTEPLAGLAEALRLSRQPTTARKKSRAEAEQIAQENMETLTEDQFATEFREIYTRLWTVAAAVLGNRSLADDVVQDAAVTGLRRLSDFRPGTNFAAWMCQIVRFTALNYRKQRSASNHSDPIVHLVEAPAASSQPAAANDVLADGQLKADQRLFDDNTLKAINELEADRRACLLLRIVHDLPYEDISEIVGIPTGTAMSHVHRAKSHLRRVLEANPGREPEQHENATA